MGYLREDLNLSMKVFGNGSIVDYYKNNTLYMYDKLRQTDKSCESISPTDITIGGFYHLHYLDDSNWMKYAPIFCVDYRNVSGIMIVMGINLNFLPLEIRLSIFDKFITEKMFNNDDFLKVDFKGAYTELLKYGFEYSITEFNASHIKMSHRIHMDILSRFLYSSHPKNKYDPSKLMQIWNAKLESREQRHQEMMVANLDEFYKMQSDILEKYDSLKDHINRLKKNTEKY